MRPRPARHLAPGLRAHRRAHRKVDSWARRGAERGVGSRPLPLLVAAVAASLVLTACTDDAADGDVEAQPVEEPETVEVVDEVVEDEDTAAGASDRVLVQDLWIHERITALRPGRDPVDLGPEVEAALEPLIDRSVEIDDGLVFHVVEALEPGLLDPDERPRDDVELLAGLLEHDGVRALAVLATPHLGAGDNVGFGDEVVLDLTVLGEELLAPGDVVVTDHGFVQAFPTQAGAADGDEAARAEEEDAAADGLELLTQRLAEGAVRYLGATDPDTGETVVGLYTGHLGVAVEGSTQVRLPSKARPMVDGMNDGLDGCDFGLQCVKSFFDKFGDGASDSWEQAWCNVGVCSDEPPPPPLRPDLDRDPDDPFGPLEVCIGEGCGGSHGEPHLATFDGRSYPMQAVGEFVLVRGPGIEVHKRTVPFADSRRASMGSAAAVAIGDVRLSYDRDRAPGERLWIDGAPVALEEVRGQGLVIGEVAVAASGDTLQVLGDGHVVSFVSLEGGSFLDVWVQLDAALVGTGEVAGLLGTSTGRVDDEFVTPDGEPLETSWRDDDFYEVFVDLWRVSDDTSLFDYPEGLGTADHTDMTMPEQVVTLDDLPGDDVAFAELVCEAAGVVDEGALAACLFDVAVTGDAGFVGSSRTAQVAGRFREGSLIPWRAIAAGLVDGPGEGEPGTQDGAGDDGAADDDGAAGEALPGTLPEVLVADSYTSLNDVLRDVEWSDGDRFTVVCEEAVAPELRGRTVRGTDVYVFSNFVCLTGVHAGVFDMESGGVAALELIERFDHPDVEVEDRNGVSAGVWARIEAGYRFLAAGELEEG